MSSATSETAVSFPERNGRKKSRVAAYSRFARTQPLATFGIAVLIFGILIAIVGPWLAPKDPYSTSVLNSLTAPSGENWFGTDNLGRDVFSRLIIATRFSLLLGLTATAVGIVIAVFLGVASAYFGGVLDNVVQRLVDAAMAIPFLLFLLMVVTMIGASFVSIAVVIGVYGGITNSRVVRGSVLGVKSEAYIEAGRAIGVTAPRMIRLHVIPNIMAPVIVIASLSLGTSILAESTLSFLGYGVPPPDPTWGQMMGLEARPYITNAPWMVIFPGFVLSLAVFAINVLGDGLRDVLDPRLRGRD